MRTRPAQRAIAASSLLALGALLTAWSWSTWPDLMIDFGREAYVAWRLGEGDVLYRDIAYHNGPLSPYWNAFVMGATGLGLRALFLSNALVMIGLVILIYRRIEALSDSWTAYAAGICFMLVFAFCRYVSIGNYAYLAPYSHEATHGLLLAFAALACTARAQREAAGDAGALRIWAIASGLLAGAVALTKVEILVALLPAIGLGLALSPGQGQGAISRRSLVPLLQSLAAAAVSAFVIWACFTLTTPISGGQAIAGMFRGLGAGFDARLSGLPFYRWGAGIDDVPGNLIRLLNVLGHELALLIPGLAMAIGLRARRPRVVLWVTAALAALVLIGLRYSVAWMAAARPLPVALLAILIWRCLPLVRAGSDAAERTRAAAELPLIVFAGLLLAKLGLNARVYQYGFVLAMPATLVVVVALLAWIPRELDRHGQWGTAFRVWSAVLMSVVSIAHLEIGTQRLPWLQSSLGEGVDRIQGEAKRAKVLGASLAEIERRVPADGTLLVLPEGVMLNYLSRRRSPTAFLNFTPFDLLLWREDSILEALHSSPPDAVLLLHRDTLEYGAQFFGSDYGHPIASWVSSRYRRWRRFGSPPLRPGTDFGAELWLPRLTPMRHPAD